MTLLPVREATQVEKVSDLDRFGGGGDHPKAARDVLERGLAVARGDLGLCEEAQQLRVLARLGSLAEPARGSYTFPERARTLDSLRQAGHPTLPLTETGLKDALPGPR